jgi:hypothetical protein
MITLDDKEKFADDFVYITFESENGCNVEMKTTFPMEDKRAEQKALKLQKKKAKQGKTANETTSEEEDDDKKAPIKGFAGEKRIEMEIEKKI